MLHQRIEKAKSCQVEAINFKVAFTANLLREFEKPHKVKLNLTKPLVVAVPTFLPLFRGIGGYKFVLLMLMLSLGILNLEIGHLQCRSSHRVGRNLILLKKEGS